MSISTKNALVCSAFMLTLGAAQMASRVLLYQSSGNNSQAKSTESRGSEKKKIQFTRGISGELLTEDGETLGFTNFSASDGVELQVLYKDFDDALKATEVFDKQISRSIKIVERGKRLDQAGKVIGERAQVILPSRGPHQKLSAVLWTDGPKFHQIQSNSLPEILELEKVYRY
jgi:hypothetical protein